MTHNMKINLIAFVFILVLSAALSACGTGESGGSNPLLGAAGLDNSTEAPVATEAPATEIPIPAASGRIIYVSNRDGQMNLYITTPDGAGQATRLTVSNSEDISPRISPDGTRVAFVSTVDSNMDIYVLDINSGAVTRVTDAPQKDSAPSWSPDGRMLAFESFRDGNFEIYAANADGSNPLRLTNDPAGDVSPIWSPVTNEIAFVSSRFGGNANILTVNLNGGISTLTTTISPESDPDWSPDGSMLAYKSSSGDLSNICVMALADLIQRCLTQTPSEYSSPVWSPDGKFVAVNGKQSTGYGVNVFTVADGSMKELHADNVDPRGAPFWSPDGFRLVFQAQVGGDMELYSALVPTNEFIRLTNVSAYDGEPIWSQ